MDLPTCEQQIKESVCATFVSRCGEAGRYVEQGNRRHSYQHAAALKLAAELNFDQSLIQLKGLTRFSNYIPGLQADIDRITRSYVQKLLADGTKAIDFKAMGRGFLGYQRALELDRNNATAKSGLAIIDRARKAYEYQTQSMAQLNAKNYKESLRLIDAAINGYPEAAEFEGARVQIVQQWIKTLLNGMPDLMTDPNDFNKTRDAYVRLTQVRSLDNGNPEVSTNIATASENFGANSLQKGNDLEQIVDYSRIGTAYVMKLNAQQRLPAGTVKPEDLKNVASAFNRKRSAQLLVSIDNLSAADATFMQTLQVRSANVLESLRLDLHIRSLEDYRKATNEDPQFQDLRPDGKSRTVLLRVGVVRYRSERISSETPIDVKSQYVSGTQVVPNPEYQKAEAELSAIRKALDNPKRNKGKPTIEGWTDGFFIQKQLNSQIARTVTQDKISDYTHSKIQHKQQTSIELNISWTDFTTREVVAQDKIIYEPAEREATEITGVRDRDINGLQNQPVRIARSGPPGR